MSSPKQNKSGIVNLLTSSGGNPKFVPPILRDVGKLAAGVASVNTSIPTGSATGNPRNKCALLPGHSLMDWIRLGSSGKDLSGVGSQAGRLNVTPSELAKHNKLSDAWLAIRGKVYNITAYLPFHPGGPEELMRGAGIDATSLFDEIHSWVNYESILQKCHVGRLVLASPSKVPEDLFTSQNDRIAPPNPPKLTIETLAQTPEKEESVPIAISHDVNEDDVLPKFDWIQKSHEISLIFHTQPMANPLVEVRKVERGVNVSLSYSNRTYCNEIVFFEEVRWPCTVKVNHETGKVECIFQKLVGAVWGNYGVLKQRSRNPGEFSAKSKIRYVVSNKALLASGVFMLLLERTDGVQMVVPVGYHVRIFGRIEGEEGSRSYTPIPPTYFPQAAKQQDLDKKLCLLVKRYTDGRMSRYVCDAIKGDILEVFKPINGGLNLSDLEKREIFLFLAAGTGITPFLSVLNFLLERRARRCRSIQLIFCNRRGKQIPLKQKFDDLSISDPRFNVTHILSEPELDWRGKTGHITKEIVEGVIDKLLASTNYPKNELFTLICGPIAFNELCSNLVEDLEIRKEQVHVFQG